jgi:hypothetical protein
MLLTVAFVAIMLRTWIRIGIEKRHPKLSDWLVAVGWVFALGWAICCAVSYRMGALEDNSPTTAPLLKVHIYQLVFQGHLR